MTKARLLTEGWTTGGRLGDHYFNADGAAVCNSKLKPGFLYGFTAKAPAGACKRCLKIKQP